MATAKAEAGGHQAVLKFVEPYLKNKAFAAEVAKVEEVRNAVLSTLKPEEQNKVAEVEEVRSAVLSTLKPEELGQATDKMSDDEFDRWVEEQKKRRVANSNPPTSPTS